MGGTGSAWGPAFDSVWNLVTGQTEEKKSPEEEKALEEKAKAEAKAKFEAITAKQRETEALVDMMPPVSFTEIKSAQEKAAEAYEYGANGIVCVSPLPPLAGGFTITIPSLESIHGSQYSLISQLLSGGSLLERTEHLHHLRRSA